MHRSCRLSSTLHSSWVTLTFLLEPCTATKSTSLRSGTSLGTASRGSPESCKYKLAILDQFLWSFSGLRVFKKGVNYIPHCSIPEMINFMNTLVTSFPVVVQSLTSFFIQVCRVFGRTFTITKVRKYARKRISCICRLNYHVLTMHF